VMWRCFVVYIVHYASKDYFASILKVNNTRIIILRLFGSEAEGDTSFQKFGNIYIPAGRNIRNDWNPKPLEV
jgi:hypothetical protein